MTDLTGKNKVSVTSAAAVQPIGYLNQSFYFVQATGEGNAKVLNLSKIKRDGTGQSDLAKLGVEDRFVVMLQSSFAFKNASGKLYFVAQDGKITKSK